MPRTKLQLRLKYNAALEEYGQDYFLPRYPSDVCYKGVLLSNVNNHIRVQCPYCDKINTYGYNVTYGGEYKFRGTRICEHCAYSFSVE